jgi:two-component system chemotaxis response regulator CheB
MTTNLVVIGASKGGLTALQLLLSSLSDRFSWAVAIAQHRIRDSESSLCDFLHQYSRLPVAEPEDKEPIEGGHVYLAPADYHLLVDKDHFALSTASPISRARPSINYLFESAADAFEAYTVGVILTGANTDGARGLAAIKNRGGMAIVEDPETAEMPAMPRAAIAATRVDHVLPLNKIAPFLNSLCATRVGYSDGM